MISEEAGNVVDRAAGGNPCGRWDVVCVCVCVCVLEIDNRGQLSMRWRSGGYQKKKEEHLRRATSAAANMRYLDGVEEAVDAMVVVVVVKEMVDGDGIR